MNEQSPAANAREALRTLVPAVEQMASMHGSLSSRNKELSDRVVDLTRLLREEQERGKHAQEQAETLAAKANRLSRLDAAAHGLVEALDRMPTTMGEAAIVPGATKPPIEVYGTFEWKSVVEAKFHVQEQLKETRSVG